jgi:hypothetical protein
MLCVQFSICDPNLLTAGVQSWVHQTLDRSICIHFLSYTLLVLKVKLFKNFLLSNRDFQAFLKNFFHVLLEMFGRHH